MEINLPYESVEGCQGQINWVYTLMNKVYQPIKLAGQKTTHFICLTHFLTNAIM